MANNPLFRVDNSPTRTTRPTKAVNEVRPNVPLTHNTFDNSYFNFKTQRFGQYEPFWWKVCTPGDNEPFSNSHNVRSLPFASPIMSPMKLNKDYFQVPMYAIQPNTWDYIFKAPSQGDDVPSDAQNLFPLWFRRTNFGIPSFLTGTIELINGIYSEELQGPEFGNRLLQMMMICEAFFSEGSLLYQLGYKMNPIIQDSLGNLMTFGEFFDDVMRVLAITVKLNFDGTELVVSTDGGDVRVVDKWTILSIIRSFSDKISDFSVVVDVFDGPYTVLEDTLPSAVGASGDSVFDYNPLDCVRMDVVNAYQLACAQYYVNPRVDFIYNSQLYRDNFIQLLRNVYDIVSYDFALPLSTFDYNGIPVLYDFFSTRYYDSLMEVLNTYWSAESEDSYYLDWRVYNIVQYLFGFREQLRFGDYLQDSRVQALGYGEEGSDVVQVMDDGVSVIDMSEKLVLQRFRSATAKLDNTAEDYLATMFKEQLPPDYHYPKFIVHSEFGINGEEISNTTSTSQGMIVTNLKSGEDKSEFNIDISVPSILIGVSYISIPYVYTQIKERSYMHGDRYDMFQPMLQYFGDQEVYNREVSDTIPNPELPYGYHSRNGEYKQRMSQASGGFLTSLRSWIFIADLQKGVGSDIRFEDHQSPIAIRCRDWEFNRFLKQQSGLSLGTGYHFIMQYNNKNVDNRPMDVNPLTLYPNSL